jgi:hypothetical protein
MLALSMLLAAGHPLDGNERFEWISDHRVAIGVLIGVVSLVGLVVSLVSERLRSSRRR